RGSANTPVPPGPYEGWWVPASPTRRPSRRLGRAAETSGRFRVGSRTRPPRTSPDEVMAISWSDDREDLNLTADHVPLIPAMTRPSPVPDRLSAGASR